MTPGHADHTHAGAATPRRTLAIVLALTLAICLIEVVGAVVAGSLALLADAGHVLTDAGGLALTLPAVVLAGRAPTAQRTWGFRRAEVLAAAAQSAVLIAVAIGVAWAAVGRLQHPADVAGTPMLVFGFVGLVGNITALALLSRSQAAHGHGFATRAVRLEVLSDALGSAAVIAAAACVALTGWTRADPIVSLVIGALILPRSWHLLRETVDVLLESVPRGVDLAQVRAHLLSVPHVREVHDLHASLVATDLPVLTAHVVVDDSCFHDGHAPELLTAFATCLAGHFDVEHSTFQLEPAGHVQTEHQVHA